MTTDDVIAQLDQYSRAYTALLRAAVRVQLQIKAHERSVKKWHNIEEEALIEMFTMGVTPHLHEAVKVLLKPKRFYQRTIAQLARQLPIEPWREKIRGLGRPGLGLLIGSLGNPADYPNPAKLWKRMGLAVAADGRAQRRQTGPQGILQGFSPTRRALMHVLGDALIKQNKTPDGGDGYYRQVYLDRKAYEASNTPDLAPIVHHKRAMRFMEKRLLRELWRAWRAMPQV